MNQLAEELNKVLEGTTAYYLLSDLGKRFFFPKGIVSQTAEASDHAHRFTVTVGMAKYKGKPAGFWPGLVHGFILPLTFIYGQFQPRVKLYETDNIGRRYNFGFVVGIIILIKAIIR